MKRHLVYPTSNNGNFKRYCDSKEADLTYPAQDRYTIYEEKVTCKRCQKKKKVVVALNQKRFR